CRAALRFERVKCCKCRSVNPAGKDAVLNLLAVEFSETDPPAGIVNLIFSGGGTLRLEVECLEAELADLGPSWPAAVRPIPSGDPPAGRGCRFFPPPPFPVCPAPPVGQGHADPSRPPRP